MYVIECMLPSYKAKVRLNPIRAEKIRFRLHSGSEKNSPFAMRPGSDPLSIYNISKPLKNRIMALRWEPVAKERSVTRFATFRNGCWDLRNNFPVIPGAQDAAFTVLEGHKYPVLHFNRTTMNPDGIGVESWVEEYHLFDTRTGATRHFATGAYKQKCGRMQVWPDGTLCNFGRWQGDSYGRGMLSYGEGKDYDQMQAVILTPDIIEGVCHPDEWIGVNDAFPLSNRFMALVLHIARECPGRPGMKEYYGCVGVFDRLTRRIVEMEIIIDANDLPFPWTPKLVCLLNIIYLGGAVRCNDLRGLMWEFYGGYADVGSFRMVRAVEMFLRYSYK